jgi:N-acetyl sugar amidotransferase
VRCCYPANTKPSIKFDDDGLCSGCKTFEERKELKIDWSAKKQEFKELLEEYRDKSRDNDSPYDCIIPISGGKDSHYQAHLITKVFKMRPLFVTYNHSYNSKIGMQNLSNIVEKFGCDLIRYSTNPITAKKISKYMLKKVGDITWHYHAGIMTFPIQMAVKYKTPLIIWGEHGMAYMFGMYNFNDQVEFTKKHRQEHLMRGFEPEDILDDTENHEITKADLAPFFYPSDDEINDVGVRGVYVANYDPWDQDVNTEMVIKDYGFQTYHKRQTTFNLYEKLEDFFQDTHNYLKYLKFGYNRCTDHVSHEIRHHRMTREEGIEMIRKYEYNVRPKNLDIFLKFTNISEKEFLDSVEHLRDKEIWEKDTDDSWKLKDWIGNHINDDGVNEARLPIKEKCNFIKTQRPEKLRDYSNLDDDEELIFL